MSDANKMDGRPETEAIVGGQMTDVGCPVPSCRRKAKPRRADGDAPRRTIASIDNFIGKYIK